MSRSVLVEQIKTGLTPFEVVACAMLLAKKQLDVMKFEMLSVGDYLHLLTSLGYTCNVQEASKKPLTVSIFYWFISIYASKAESLLCTLSAILYKDKRLITSFKRSILEEAPSTALYTP